MSSSVTQRRAWFLFKPEADAWIALATVPAMTLIYYLNTQYGYAYPAVFFVGFIFLGHIILNTVVPAYVVLKMQGEGLSGLGITTKKVPTALIISALLAASMFPSLKMSLKGFDGNLAPNIAYNAIALWEPLFVFGWLQLRFERAFGVIPAILLAGFSFMAYHIGSFPISGLIALGVAGIFYAIVFALVRNLLVLMPLTWAIASTMGTIQGGFIFDWGTVVIYAGVLSLQALILWAFSKRSFSKTFQFLSSKYQPS